ncbi:MAG: hypothetical protein B7Z73_04690 [Planctomycetia bacterium 21-64-5]|nr:MAG: hypothetical protein B7Z73_04690 [Planctomycetia bacterium 21-64-5]HQU43974.1 HlyD family efflux transporter periplasmic adaptor subunit [Pirellulales bacterium]
MLGVVVAALACALPLLRRPPAELPEMTVVNRGDVVATLDVEGNVESAYNFDITCQVQGGSTILWIVPDGTHVNQGDELVRFDSSAVEDLLSQQAIVVERARAAQIAAEHELSAARLALPEYVQGTFVELNQQADAAIATATHNLRLAQQTLAAHRRLFRSGYIGHGQVQACAFGVEQAELQLDIARRAKTVLEDYNRPKMTQEIETRLATAAALVRSTTAEFELTQIQLARYHQQLDHCTVRAPHSGLAIYANDPRRSSSDGPQIEAGVFVRQRQAVLWLPDLATMQARVLVHESSVLRLRPGQRAAVRVRGRDFPATVTQISNQPFPMRSSQQHLKYFVVVAKIEEPSPGLRPGESADVALLLDYRPDVLRAPLETVVKERHGAFVWVERDGTLEPRRVELGTCGDEGMAEIRRGASEGEHVVLNPRDTLPEMGIEVDSHSERGPDRFRTKHHVTTASHAQHTGGNAAGG